MTWVKICGIKSVDDAMAVARTGVAAVGLNLFPKSRRFVDVHRARKISEALIEQAPHIARVGVMVDLEGGLRAHMEVGRKALLTHLQLHGDEDPDLVGELCARGWSVIKAIRLDEGDDLEDLIDHIETYLEASDDRCSILVDARADGAYGGTGKRIDVSLLRDLLIDYPLIVAGGLNPRNVSDVLRLAPISDGVEPGICGVDVASGVEGRNGRKDISLVRRFVAACRC